MKNRLLLTTYSFMAALALGVLGSASTAAAQFTIPDGYRAQIGQWNGQGGMRLQNKVTGACGWIAFGTGGLQGDVVVNGSGARDEIHIATSPVIRYCTSSTSSKLTPLVYNGHRLTVDALGGNDTISGGGNGNELVVDGSSGKDLVQNYAGWETWGGSEDDKLYGMWNDWMQGEGGNDIFHITTGTQADTANGGPGDDTICGGTAVHIIDVEFGCI